jgi:hypothetical protein
MQIHQGCFVAEVKPIKNKGTLQTTHFRIRLVQLFPVEQLIAECVARSVGKCDDVETG